MGLHSLWAARVVSEGRLRTVSAWEHPCPSNKALSGSIFMAHRSEKSPSRAVVGAPRTQISMQNAVFLSFQRKSQKSQWAVSKFGFQKLPKKVLFVVEYWTQQPTCWSSLTLEFFYFGTQDSEFCDLEGLCHKFFIAQFHLEFITAQSVESKSQGDLDFPFLSKPFRWQEPIVIFLQKQIQHDIEAKVAQQ